MNARQRVSLALDHREPDRVPLDLGASPTSGMHVSSVYLLRQALGLDAPGAPVKIVEPYQLLGEIAPDLMDALGVDIAPLPGPRTMFGFANDDWRPWTTFDGTPALVPAGFNIDPEENGDILMYPEGDRAAPPSGRMPAGGYYFDAIIRQPPIDDASLDPADNLQEFGPISEADLAHYAREAAAARAGERAVLANFGGTAFGDIALVPAPALKHPRGIRDIAEWYMSTVSRRDYVFRVFERQCEIGLENLSRIHAVVGDAVDIVFVTGADFGMQTGPFISPKMYRDLYAPFHREVNGWIHAHTNWKTFMHSCGSIMPLIPDFIAAGFDILNPVQTSADGMDAGELKSRFGNQVVFWGGGIDTQKTLPFGAPDDVRAEVRENIRTFGAGGGFVFNTIHNVQARVPVENLLALYEAVREYGEYPLK
jgi:hypothetical protein